MTHADAERWNARYSRPGETRSYAADDVLRACEAMLPSAGRALDIACGAGGNALWLAEKGFSCVGLDVSEAGLRLTRKEARRRGLCLDLVEADARHLPFAPACFHLVVVTRFLERALFPQIRKLLTAGGCVFYRTFNQRRRASHPSFNAEFLLDDAELLAAFQGFEVLASNEDGGETAQSSHILARRPANSA